MPTVGVFSLMPLPGFAGRLAVYARALAEHGATVHRILCDGVQPRCAVDTFLSALPNRFGHCPGCHAGNRWLAGLGGQDDEGHLAAGSLLDREAQTAALAEIAALADADLVSWTYRGHPCGSWLDNAMRSETGTRRWQQLPGWDAVARGWLGTMVTGMLTAEGYIRRYRPDALLVPNGRLAAERGIRAVAGACGIPVYTEDTGLRPGHYAIRRNSPACDYDFAAEWAQWADIPLTADEDAELDGFLDAWLVPDQKGAYAFSPSPTGDLAGLRQSLDLREDRPVIAVFGGVLNDTSLFNADRIYPGQAEWLDGVIRLAAQRPDWDVVIRLHPVDVATHMRRQGRTVAIPDTLQEHLRQAWPELPANVRVIDPGSPLSSHDLLAISRMVLTYVSTVGIEATLRGLPVLLGGWPHYAHCGFTWRQQTPDDLIAWADRLMATPEQPGDARILARRYVCLAYLRGMFDFSFLTTDERAWDLPVEMRRLTTLAAEGAGDLTRLCEVILGRRPLVDPPAGRPPQLPAPVPAQPPESSPLQAPARLTIAVACPDDNGFPIDWSHLAPLADQLLVVTGPQRRTPGGMPPQARLIAAATNELADCWQTALAEADTDWVLLLQAGDVVTTSPQDLQAITRLRPLSPVVGLAAMRGGDVPDGSWWEPRLLSRAADWRFTGKAWPHLTGAGRHLGERACLLPGVSVRSRFTLPVRLALHRSLTWLRAGLAATPDSLAWQQTLIEVLRPCYPIAANRHERMATDQTKATLRLSVAILVTAETPLSRLTLHGIDGVADDLLVVTPPTVTIPAGLVESYAGRRIVAADAAPASLLAAAQAAAKGTWLLTLRADETLSPGAAEALTVWMQTMGATKTGALITCESWPLAGQPPAQRPEQRLWRRTGGGSSLSPLTTVPGTTIWQPPQGAGDVPVTATPVQPSSALLPAVLRLMQGELSGARADLLAWRRTSSETDPDRETGDEWLITTALALGDWPLALAVAAEVLTRRCTRPVLAIQAATALQAIGDVRGAALACQLAVAARQTWEQGPAEIGWQPELLMASMRLGLDGPTVAQAWLSGMQATGPLAMMQALLGTLTGETAAVAAAGVRELAAELEAGGWLAPDGLGRL